MNAAVGYRCYVGSVDPLHPIEVRLLGSLLEKDITTPEYYPITVNALVNACNQKSNRDPVVNYDQETVQQTLESLRSKGWVLRLSGAGHRVVKYGHRISEQLNLGRRELALLDVLMLRGPQTPGALRARTERMYEFSDLDEVEACLRSLMERDPDPLVVRLPVQPGSKEARYTHLLSGEPDLEAVEEVRTVSPAVESALERRVAALETEFERLKQEFAEFRRQFE